MGRNFLLVPFLVFGCLFGPVSPVRGVETEKEIEQPVKEAIDIRRTAQTEAAAWQQEKEALLIRFDRLEQERDGLRKQKEALTRDVEAARARVAAKERQLADIRQIGDQIQPFLNEQVQALAFQLSEGLPFLTAERRDRIDRLKTVIDDPEVPVSEKYRKVMEALLVEAEYGFTIEVYRETLPAAGRTLLADVFRLGRLSLFYLSPDGTLGGFYNVAEGSWKALPPIHLRAIQAAAEIASKRRTAELVPLPLGRIAAP